MKSSERKKASITAPLLQGIVDQLKKDRDRQADAVVETQPVQAPDLEQDAGGGFNADGTYPQV